MNLVCDDDDIIKQAKSVCLGKDIKELLRLHDFFNHAALKTPHSNEYWYNLCLQLCKQELHGRGISTIFDDTIFKSPEAPGLIVRKDIAENRFIVTSDPYDLEVILGENSEIKDDCFAKELYTALCNMMWYKNGVYWSCSWRRAGDIIAKIRNRGEDYMTYYCSGGEGRVSKRIEEVLHTLGWSPLEYE